MVSTDFDNIELGMFWRQWCETGRKYSSRPVPWYPVLSRPARSRKKLRNIENHDSTWSRLIAHDFFLKVSDPCFFYARLVSSRVRPVPFHVTAWRAIFVNKGCFMFCFFTMLLLPQFFLYFVHGFNNISSKLMSTREITKK